MPIETSNFVHFLFMNIDICCSLMTHHTPLGDGFFFHVKFIYKPDILLSKGSFDLKNYDIKLAAGGL